MTNPPLPPPIDAAHASSATVVRVRFCETDLMGIVHHAAYLTYFEAGRVEWLRRRGVAYRTWAARGTNLPVVEATVRYRLPASFDDVLDLTTTLVDLRSASLRFAYRLTREGTFLTEGNTRLACIDGAGAVRRFDADMIAALVSPERGQAW